ALHVYQRTPPWVMPHPKRDVTEAEHWLFRTVPLAQRAMRGFIYTGREGYILNFAGGKGVNALAERIARRHMRRQVSDPQLRRRPPPTSRLGCKRVLPSTDSPPALTQPNVEVIVDGIREVRRDSVVTNDGTERQTDTIIFGTGFHVTDPPVASRICG